MKTSPSAAIADGATGPIGTAAGQLSRASFSLGPFTAGAHRVGIAFNYVFDTSLAPGTTGARSPDDFYVQLVNGNGVLVELLRFDDGARNEASRRGLYSAPVDFSLASASFSCRRSQVIVNGFVFGISKNDVTPPFAQARVAVRRSSL